LGHPRVIHASAHCRTRTTDPLRWMTLPARHRRQQRPGLYGQYPPIPGRHRWGIHPEVLRHHRSGTVHLVHCHRPYPQPNLLPGADPRRHGCDPAVVDGPASVGERPGERGPGPVLHPALCRTARIWAHSGLRTRRRPRPRRADRARSPWPRAATYHWLPPTPRSNAPFAHAWPSSADAPSEPRNYSGPYGIREIRCRCSRCPKALPVGGIHYRLTSSGSACRWTRWTRCPNSHA
jgi:hypothetical protein